MNDAILKRLRLSLELEELKRIHAKRVHDGLPRLRSPFCKRAERDFQFGRDIPRGLHRRGEVAFTEEGEQNASFHA